MSTDEEDKQLLKWILVSLILISFLFLTHVFTTGAKEEQKPLGQLGDMVVQQTNPYQDPLDDLVERIIFCESGGRVDAQNKHSSAYGLCQFLTGTWNYVSRKWDMELDRHSYDDQLYACKRLLETEGCRHWRESAHCHGCYE